jgi:hypothetical protein
MGYVGGVWAVTRGEFWKEKKVEGIEEFGRRGV